MPKARPLAQPALPLPAMPDDPVTIRVAIAPALHDRLRWHAFHQRKGISAVVRELIDAGIPQEKAPTP